MTERGDLGRAGEDLAAAQLERCGMRVLARNVRLSEGREIDIVAMDGGTLVCVEVRSRRASWVEAADSIGPRKQERVRLAAEEYAARHDGPFEALRVDVVLVEFRRDGRPPRVRHLPDAIGG